MALVKSLYQIAIKNKLLLLILTISGIFRFYNLLGLQYFSDGEVLFYSILDQIVNDHRLILISPNQIMGINLGSFLHWIVSPIFLLAKGNPMILGGIGSALGIVVTYLTYKAGSLINKKVGLLSALIYASSMMIAINDRRFWQLSFNSLFCVLSYIAMYFVVKNKKSYIPPLIFMFTSIFAWHADLTLLTIPLFGLFVMVKNKIKISKRFIPAILLLIFSFLPLIIFEFRHDFVNTKAISNIVSNNYQKKSVGMYKNISLVGDSLLRMVFISPRNLSINFKYAHEYEQPPYIMLSALIWTMVIYGVYIYNKNKKNGNLAYELNILYLITFFGGILLYLGLNNGTYYDHYLVSIFPMLAVFMGSGIYYWIRKKNVGYLLLGMFIYLNFSTLFQAKMSHPVKNKLDIVSQLSPKLGDGKFAAYDVGVEGAGFHYIYDYHHLYPVKSSAIDAWGWIYMSNSFLKVTPESGWPDTVLILRDNDGREIVGENIVTQSTAGDIQGIVLDNSGQWVDMEAINELK